MAESSRDLCPECGRSILIRKNDELRAHNDLSEREPFRCPGSGWIPEECAAEMRSRGFTPHPDYIRAKEPHHA